MKNPNRALAVCGIIAPVFYLLMTIIGGALSPGYSHITETVSELLWWLVLPIDHYWPP